MGYNKMFVTILIFTTVFFSHLNLSSSFINRLQSLFEKNELNFETNTSIDVNSETNHQQLPFELNHLAVYPSQTVFREFITPSLNSEKICNLYEIAKSKNPSVSPQNFLPPARFFKSHTILTIPEGEQKILYNFNFGTEKPTTKFSKFNPIVYNPTNKTLETLNPGEEFLDTANISDGCIVAQIEKYFLPIRPELNATLAEGKNKTLMIATKKNPKTFGLILEDTGTDETQYSLLRFGKYEDETETSVRFRWNDENMNADDDWGLVEFPRDIGFIPI